MKLVASVFLLLLTSCGFHLRTWDLGTNLESARVEAGLRSQLARPLRRALGQSGVNEAAQGESQVVIELLDQRSNRRSISVTGQARAAEYETTLEVRFQVHDAKGVELIAARWIRSERVFRVDRDNLVGNSEEQALIEREMRDDLIQQILRSLNAITQTVEETAADAG
ncbi:MAG: LPS assembly lipoprotein LptE [Gammaproteobacteria bacterium]|nr:LPS assembly lipoprotein LptE [Gammaproteobacteria bacterium]MCZ6855932.1 LPS assembly lipoprotein LptE [Gammaproteobacteria bacterium]